MKRLKKADYIIILVVIFLILGIVGTIFLGSRQKAAKADAAGEGQNSSLSLEDYNGKTIGVQTGTNFDEMVKKFLPDAKIEYFNSNTDLLTALVSGRIDAFTGDEPIVRNMIRNKPEVSYLDQYLDDYAFGYAFAKTDEGKKLCDEMSEFIRDIKKDGTLKEIDELWFGNDDSVKTIPPLDSLSGEKGTLKFAIESANEPFIYVKDGKNIGYEIDIAYRFCEKYGYGLSMDSMNFDAIIPAITSGKYDIGAAGMTITEERKESINFSEPEYEGGAVLAVLDGGKTAAADLDAKSYNGKKIGVKSGTIFDQYVEAALPDAELMYFNSYTDLQEALSSGKVEAFAADEPTARYIKTQDKNTDYLKDYLEDYDFGYVFSKNEKGKKLSEELSGFISELKSSGTIDEIEDLWYEGSEEEKTIPLLDELSAENGTLTLAVDSICPPFIYVKDEEIVGFEVDIIYRFCKEYGYGLKIEDMKFDSIIPGVSTGKYDIGAGEITITDERAESVYFSEPHYSGGTVLVVPQENAGTTAEEKTVSLSDYNGKKLGILTGSNYEDVTFDNFPDSEYLYYNSVSDMIPALQNGNIDGFVEDEPIARVISSENKELSYLEEMIQEDDYYFAFKKDSDISKKAMPLFNEFIAKEKESGRLDELKEKWTGDGFEEEDLEEPPTSGKNGIIRVVTISDYPPFSFVGDGKLKGYAVELISEFARAYGFGLEIDHTSVSSGIAGLESGKYDIIACNVSYTKERAENMDFTDAIYNGGVVLVTRKSDSAAESKETSKAANDDFNGMKTGIIAGSMHDDIINKYLPDSSIAEYKNYTDLTAALESGNVDYYLIGDDAIPQLLAENKNLTYVEDPIDVMEAGVMFPKTEKGAKIRAEFDELIEELKSSGELDEILAHWTSPDIGDENIDVSKLEAKNGTLKLATSGSVTGCSYVANGRPAGFDPYLAYRFCEKYGYGLEVEMVEMDGVISGLKTGLYDFAMNHAIITEERKGSVDFSVPYIEIGIHIVTTKDIMEEMTGVEIEKTEETGFIEGIKESFEKNFVRENRWKLILEGMGTTLLITLLSVIAGSVLAFLICMFRRLDSYLAPKIATVYVKLLQGTPIVVLLMILYYVVFGRSGLSSVWVAVIGFSLNFAAYTSETLRSGIESVDAGQREAALALGYTENQSFFKFIFPQAALRQIPVYRGEIITLLKNTSIVGYIAIQDLTKMSDIIRSRTYEAFFPLIVTAVIYFILAWILTLVLKIALRKIDPKAGKRRVKGVKTV